MEWREMGPATSFSASSLISWRREGTVGRFEYREYSLADRAESSSASA
jgi:hypothetical protein